MLHLVVKSPEAGHSLAQALACAGEEDDLVLMQDAVLAAPAAFAVPSALAAAMQGRRCHVLQADLDARGLGTQPLRAGVQAIDDAAWVALAVRHASSLTWT